MSFTELRTHTKKLELLLAARQLVLLTKGSRKMGVVVPHKEYQARALRGKPLFLKGYDLGGEFKVDVKQRASFYE